MLPVAVSVLGGSPDTRSDTGRPVERADVTRRVRPMQADNVEEVDGRYRGRPVFSFGPCASRRATVSRGTPRRSFDTMGLHEKDSPRSPPNLTQGAAGLPRNRSCRARRADKIRAGQGCGGRRESRRGISDRRIRTWKSSTELAFPFRDQTPPIPAAHVVSGFVCAGGFR